MMRFQASRLTGVFSQAATAASANANAGNLVGGVQAQQRRHRSNVHTITVSGDRQIAYRQVPGHRQPTVVVVPGLHSYAHMNGLTAKSISR